MPESDLKSHQGNTLDEVECPWCPACLTDLIFGGALMWHCPRCRARRFTEQLRLGVAAGDPAALVYDAEHTP